MDYGKEQKFNLDQYNLDTDEWDYSPERDARALGNKIISNTPDSLSTPTTEAEPLLELNQPPSLMPPGYPQEPSQPQSQTTPSPAESPVDSLIAPLVKKAQNSEKFTYQDAKIVETSINSELAQTGDIASAYEEVRAYSAPTGEAI